MKNATDNITAALDALQDAKRVLFETSPHNPGPEHAMLQTMIHELYDMRERFCTHHHGVTANIVPAPCDDAASAGDDTLI